MKWTDGRLARHAGRARTTTVMKLVGALAGGSQGLRLVLALEIQCHCGADEILQCRLVNFVAFVDLDISLNFRQEVRL